ncbi:hypothetical protein IPN35_02560 [Candidatus Peregrinibacteria bacterium]|nr:MAG: hypothetical protein IPN35_02560 [Candidatus Peregrinibacteria bacterium]
MPFQRDHLRLSTASRIGIVLLFFVTIFQQNYVVSVGAFISIILSLLPGIVGKNSKAHLPWSLDFLVSFALLLNTMGNALNFYHDPSWWWWDELTHALGSFAVGMIAFHLVFTLNFLGKVTMSVPMMGFFLFLSAMGIGGLWEIFEYYSDFFLGTHMQISLPETMRDLQFDVLGAFAISGIAMRYFFVKRQEGVGDL